MPKKGGLGQCADLRGLGKKEGLVFFRGGLIPQCTLWDIIGNLRSNLISRSWPKFFKLVDIWYLKKFLVLTLKETSFATTSYSFNFFFWFVNYANMVYKLLYFGSVKHCLCWKVLSTNIYGNIFSTVCCFFSYICWPVNCMSWVSKFHNLFLTYSKTEARCVSEGFWYCHLCKVQFQHFCTFLAFFHLVSKLLKSPFNSLFVSQ